MFKIISKYQIYLLLILLTPVLSGCVVRDNFIKLVNAAKESSEARVDYFKVVKVVDGDTIDISYYGKTERVRLIGINAPESVDPRKPAACFGKESALEARKLLDGKYVQIEADKTQDDRDKYGRLLRYVTTREGLFFNLEIVKRGFAYEFTYKVPYKYQTEFKSAQDGAKNSKLGLWAESACGAKTVKTNKVVVPQVKTTNLCQIKGNINSGKKTYFKTTCRGYANVIVTPSKGEKFFCSESEAQKAGFKKLVGCK